MVILWMVVKNKAIMIMDMAFVGRRINELPRAVLIGFVIGVNPIIGLHNASALALTTTLIANHLNWFA